METKRSTRKYCSQDCERKKRTGYPKSRACLHCTVTFQVLTRGDANRRHCSKECAKNHNAKRVGNWQRENLEVMRGYGSAWRNRNPDYYKARAGKKRQEILDLLGGACVVCGVTKPSWLHVDYVHGSRGLPFRHPRHLSYIEQHVEDFRVLCANHHYELTLTGRIEGTSIMQ